MREVKFFVTLSTGDGMIVTVIDDENGSNNPDVEEVLKNWIKENYRDEFYDYWKLDECDKHKI